MEISGWIRERVPLIEFPFCGRMLEACVDTGFNGALMIPRQLAKDAKLDHLFDVEVETASGETLAVEAYAAEVSWFGQDFQVEVITTHGQFALLGMSLLENTRLILEPSKGLVKITPVLSER